MKYIDAEKLIAEIERKIGICEQQRADAIKVECYTLADDASARMGELRVLLETITSLQHEQPDEVLIPMWCLENIENTLRIQHNINNDTKDGETCQDRNIKESLNCVRKLLNGEKITGRERSEPLMKQPEVDLEEAAAAIILKKHPIMKGAFTMEMAFYEMLELVKAGYELGLNARKEE